MIEVKHGQNGSIRAILALMQKEIIQGE